MIFMDTLKTLVHFLALVKKEGETDWSLFHILATRWLGSSILFFITIIEARFHSLAFEACSPQTLYHIIENDLKGHNFG